MNSLKRNKRILYLCKRYIEEGTNITKFKEPVKIRIDWQPISADSQVLNIGVDYSKYLTIKGTVRETSQFDNKDRCYVYVEPDTENFNGMCDDADYEVSSPPVNMLNDGEIMLRKLSGED